MAAMGPSYTTIIAPIEDGRVDALKRYLRDAVNPGPAVAPGDGLACRPDFPFGGIATLHFCSLLVLDRDDEAGLPAELILEATFDGGREVFLRELLAIAPRGMAQVFEACAGYPLKGATLANGRFSFAEIETFVTYLVSMDVGANAYFSGSPGRTVRQIKDESRLKVALRDDLAGRRLAALPMPATNEGLQESLKDRVRAEPGLHFAQTRADVPWEVRLRDRILGLAVLVILAGLTLAGGVLLGLFGVGPGALLSGEMGLLNYAEAMGSALSAWGFAGAGASLSALERPLASGMLVLASCLLLVRWLERVIEDGQMDPHNQGSLSDVLGLALLAARLGLLGLLAAFAMLIAAALVTPVAGLAQPVVREIVALREAAGISPGADDRTTAFVSALLVAAGIALLAGLAWTSTTLDLALQRAPQRYAVARKLAIDIVRGLEITVLVAMAIVLLRHLGWLRDPLLQAFAIIGHYGVVLLVWAGTGTAAIMCVVAGLLAGIRLAERRDSARFRAADELTSGPIGNQRARAREEGGSNLYQNHLASLTYVKPGRFRLALLKATLWLIGLLARFLFNRGSLGGIPTILSARWVVIDGGRRLIFLDNYGGGWESYLNEFIDMGAVKGLNAIWTNTFIKWRRSADAAVPERYAFPATTFYTAGGARQERPFKTYVRLSQVETIAWYSAYHTLSILNVNANTDVRQALFEPLPSHEVDDLIARL